MSPLEENLEIVEEDLKFAQAELEELRKTVRQFLDAEPWGHRSMMLQKKLRTLSRFDQHRRGR